MCKRKIKTIPFMPYYDLEPLPQEKIKSYDGTLYATDEQIKQLKKLGYEVKVLRKLRKENV